MAQVVSDFLVFSLLGFIGRTVPEAETLVAGFHDMAVMCQPSPWRSRP